MIRGEHTIIRAAESDDAATLRVVYDMARPRSCVLDHRRELVVPTLDELREAMNQKEMGRSAFSAVEDLSGAIRGFCSLRGLSPELSYSEYIVMFLDEADYAGPLADEVHEHLSRLAFQRLRLNKVITHCLECESAYREFLLAHGFGSDGRQRDVVFSQGRYHDLEALSLFGSSTAHAAVNP